MSGVDRGDQADKGNVRVEYSLPLKSEKLGLTGKADVVEFHLNDSAEKQWVPFPVEYKRGKPKQNDSDKVQLCAQALCLEEMLGYKGRAWSAVLRPKQGGGKNVIFDDALRKLTFETAQKLHSMMALGNTPPAPI